MWVVDTCVIIDVLQGDGVFSIKSADAIDAKRNEGLVIAPTTYVELSPSFNGNVDEQDTVLSNLGIDVDFGEDRDAIRMAHKAWFDHVLRKRSGGAEKRPIADVMIGAYAMRKDGLITRNEADFRSLYPGLEIFNPISLMSH